MLCDPWLYLTEMAGLLDLKSDWSLENLWRETSKKSRTTIIALTVTHAEASSYEAGSSAVVDLHSMLCLWCEYSGHNWRRRRPQDQELSLDCTYYSIRMAWCDCFVAFELVLASLMVSFTAVDRSLPQTLL